MYDGPVIDAYFHPSWGEGSDRLSHAGTWREDPIRATMLKTFGLPDADPIRPANRKEDGETDGGGLKRTIADMDAAGVERGVLPAVIQYAVPRDAVERCVAQQYEVVESCRARFAHVGIVVPPPQGPATYWDVLENVRMVEDHKTRLGIVGVHIMPSPWGIPPNDRWFYPLYARCAELDLAVYSYVGLPGPSWPGLPNDPLHLDEVALAFPTLRIFAHHIGAPWVALMTRLAAKHENLFIVTSAWSPKRYPRELMEFVAGKWHGTWGADKVLFGTAHPVLDVRKATSDARRLDLSPSILEKCLYSNARTHFFDDR